MKLLRIIILTIFVTLSETKDVYLRGDNKQCKNDFDCRKNVNCVDGVTYCECVKGKCYFS